MCSHDSLHSIKSFWCLVSVQRKFALCDWRMEEKKKMCFNMFEGLMIYAGEGGREATRPGTEKRCSDNLQSDPLGSGFKKGRENFPQ